MANGQGTAHDLDRLTRINELSSSMSQCGLGQTAHHALADALNYFPECFTKRLQTERHALAIGLAQEIDSIPVNVREY